MLTLPLKRTLSPTVTVASSEAMVLMPLKVTLSPAVIVSLKLELAMLPTRAPSPMLKSVLRVAPALMLKTSMSTFGATLTVSSMPDWKPIPAALTRLPAMPVLEASKFSVMGVCAPAVAGMMLKPLLTPAPTVKASPGCAVIWPALICG